MSLSYQEEMVYRTVPDIMSQNECSLHSAIHLIQKSNYTLNVSVMGYTKWLNESNRPVVTRSKGTPVLEFTTPTMPVNKQKK